MEGWLAAAADEFWDAVGGEIPVPRDLEEIVSLAFPVTCVPIPQLSVGRLERWLAARGTPFVAPCRDRSLLGCIVGVRGKGLIVYSAGDPSAERRFTVAHEIAHFLLDYREPRERALRAFGLSILPVLDGERAPTYEERIDALLDRVHLGLYMDLMPRAQDGGIERGSILRAENRADRLALELLAPREQVLALLPGPDVTQYEQFAAAAETLVDTFGLPEVVAERYAAALLRGTRRLTLAEWLRA